ncbi:MAG: lysoplasmalogenase, partial [Acidimicrobiia bacterium]
LGEGARESAYGRWVLVGLALSFLGDVFLMLRGRSWFQAGLASFLSAHLAYIAAFLVAGIAITWALFAAGASLVVAWFVLRWLLPHVDREMRGPVLAYVAVISIMVSLAVGTLGAGQTWLVAAGAGVFYTSDLFVARDRFVTPGFLNSAVGLPLYYVGQVLLALSVAM